MSSDEQKQPTSTPAQARLEAQKKKAHRQALKDARLAEEGAGEDAVMRRGSVNGAGTIQIVFMPPVQPDVVEKIPPPAE